MLFQDRRKGAYFAGEKTKRRELQPSEFGQVHKNVIDPDRCDETIDSAVMVP